VDIHTVEDMVDTTDTPDIGDKSLSSDLPSLKILSPVLSCYGLLDVEFVFIFLLKTVAVKTVATDTVPRTVYYYLLLRFL
jgi:hypothetical protein